MTPPTPTQELLPCPFAFIKERYHDPEACRETPTAHWIVACSCGAQGPDHKDREEAIRLWNTRHQDDSTRRKLEGEIRVEQEHGRTKYGSGPNDFAHDDAHHDGLWHECIYDHNSRARCGTPLERRQHLIKVAGLAISAIESFDRKQALTQPERKENE